jgi:hypothetical protein
MHLSVYTHDLCNPPVIVPILSEITKPRAPPPAPGGEPEPPEGRHPLPARRHLEIIDYLQTMLEPNLFTPRGIYDGKKNFFITRELGDKRKVSLNCNLTRNTVADVYPRSLLSRLAPPRVEANLLRSRWIWLLVLIRGIVPAVPNGLSNNFNGHISSVLHRVVAGQATGKEGISAVTCLNVAVRMVPIM